MNEKMMNEEQNTIPFDSIRKVILDFKRKNKCDDIVFPGLSDFRAKWGALTNSIPKMTGRNPSLDDAIALIDCTVMGGCEHGALIDKSGIYMVNEKYELDGWLDWENFIANADIGASDSFQEVMICSQPNVGLDISGCDLNMRQSVELFWKILQTASNGKANESQVRLVSQWEQTKDTGCSCIAAVVVLALLGWGGYALYKHIPNIKGWFSNLTFFKGKEEERIPMDPATEMKTAAELFAWIKANDKMTELQRDVGFKKLKGRMVIVSGEVREIGKTMFSDKPFVSLSVGKIDLIKRINIQFNVSDALASTVVEWQKGERHIMRGCIYKRGDLTDDVVCDKVELLDKSEELYKYLESAKPPAASQSKASSNKVTSSSGEDASSEESSSPNLMDMASGIVPEKRRKQFNKLSAAAQLFMNDEQKAKLQELKDKAKSTVEEIDKSMTDEDREKLKTLKEGASTALELYRELKPKKNDED